MKQRVAGEVLDGQQSSVADKQLDDLTTTSPRCCRQTQLSVRVLRFEVVTVSQSVD